MKRTLKQIVFSVVAAMMLFASAPNSASAGSVVIACCQGSNMGLHSEADSMISDDVISYDRQEAPWNFFNVLAR